jgi:CheY-like chemotaxis protein
MVYSSAIVSATSAVSLYEKAAATMAPYVDILLVEDEPDIVDFMERMLRSAGYTIRVVADGLAAVTAIRIHPPAVMILDLVLPVMSGWAVLEQLHRDQHHIPVIVITANPNVSARLSGYCIRHCLVKPFLMGELLDALAQVYPAQQPH